MTRTPLLPGRAGRLGLALLLAVWGATGLVVAVQTVALRLAFAAEAALAGPSAFRATERGSAYQTAVERIRSVLGPDEPYLLVDAGGKAGEPFWVRHDLAPRRAAMLGVLSRDGELAVFSPLPDPLPRWVVVVSQWPTPPRIEETVVYLQARHQALVRGSDPGVHGTLTSARVTPEGLVVEGACVDPGGPPCHWMRVFLDGKERGVSRLVRRPVADLPGSGARPSDLAAAGFAATVPLKSTDTGRAVVSVAYVTADGRFRSPFPLQVELPR